MSGTGRLRALDVFRGATLAGMIVVNNPGGSPTFAPLEHAPWHGWTVTDLIFPFFLFIVGVAIPYAFAARLEQARGERRALYRQVLRRTAILFALGLFLNWFPFYTVHWERARIAGVLQRIAVVYALAALAYLRLGSRARLWLSAGLLVAYWLAMTLVPVPGFGAGDLSAAGNLAGWVDHAVLGQHVWRYAPGPADPEGLLSTLPAVVTALAGVATGEWLRSAKSLTEKLVGLFLAGNLLLAAGLLWNPLFPINKNLWTSSYVLFTAGFALAVLGIALYAVDVRGGGRWTVPFEVLGANSIAAFFGSTFVAKLLYVIRVPAAEGPSVGLGSWLYARSFELWLPPYWASLAWALLYLLLWLGLMAWLYRRRIFWKV